MASPVSPPRPAPALVDLYGKKDKNGKPLADNCSGFIKATLERLGIAFHDKRANDLIADIEADPTQWIHLGKGAENGREAAGAAERGYLVLAVLKGREHSDHRETGHISVVLPKIDHDGYPFLISGSTIAAGKSDGSKSVLGVWRRIDAPSVKYYRTSLVYPELVPPSFGR